MVGLLQNTSNLKKLQDKVTQFLLIYLFILVLEIALLYTEEENEDIKDINIFNKILCP